MIRRTAAFEPFTKIPPALLAIVSALLLANACATTRQPHYGETVWADFGTECPADAPPRRVSQAWLDSLAAMRARATQKLPNQDEEAAARSRAIPGGFAGLYFPNGKPEIFLVDTTQRGAAIAAVVSLFHPSAPYNLPLDTSTVRARRVRWDYDTLNSWYVYLQRHGMFEAGVRFTDIREEQNRIEFGVYDERARARVLERLRELDVPCLLVAVSLAAPAVAGVGEIPR
jgi:hypothetical protein